MRGVGWGCAPGVAGNLLMRCAESAETLYRLVGEERPYLHLTSSALSPPSLQQLSAAESEHVAPSVPPPLTKNEEEKFRSGRWSASEHDIFLRALKVCGRDWMAISRFVRTRSKNQTRKHAQKYFAMLRRKQERLENTAVTVDEVRPGVSKKLSEREEADARNQIESMLKRVANRRRELLWRREQAAAKEREGKAAAAQATKRVRDHDDAALATAAKRVRCAPNISPFELAAKERIALKVLTELACF
uniref:HTH myb-type domain-containing protein n=1 Tax=Phaeomonas parva TaxID=124430 RepID=A0A7S1U3K5_9STRA|mmetsp:Transcript_29445/g.94557  ORF Transcript_29445/g.94557 Transcript_29445/m.94557 type:complete len:247 (+) Transcript_29445:562-1302(+)